jgi:fructose-specific phosphotransferase system IIC component
MWRPFVILVSELCVQCLGLSAILSVGNTSAHADPGMAIIWITLSSATGALAALWMAHETQYPLTKTTIRTITTSGVAYVVFTFYVGICMLESTPLHEPHITAALIVCNARLFTTVLHFLLCGH